MPARKRVLSGMRATGKMHLGHLVGALENWVKLQDQYQCFFFVADWHALTTDYADTRGIPDSTIQMVTDWLAAGLDPEKSTLFLQSRILEHSELHLLASSVTRSCRRPTFSSTGLITFPSAKTRPRTWS
jgi:tryptophanyl-tRNA synthetase